MLYQMHDFFFLRCLLWNVTLLISIQSRFAIQDRHVLNKYTWFWIEIIQHAMRTKNQAARATWAARWRDCLSLSFLQIDLYYIKKEYLRWYSTQLHEAIKKQCGRNYANLLTVILELRGQYSESAKKRWNLRHLPG